MKKNINVSDIVNVYYSETDKWKRKVQKPRACDAIVLFVEGEIVYFFEDQEVMAKQGDLMILPGNLPYSGESVSEKNAYFVLNFNSMEEDELMRLGAPAVRRVSDFESVRNSFLRIMSCWQSQEINAELRIKSFLYEQLADFCSVEAVRTLERSENEVITYIQDHYCEPNLTVSHLCADFFISESQLRRNIKKAMGVSPGEYITALRMNKAKNELMQSRCSVKQIASACGFESPYYFSRCFSKHVGMSPKVFRQRFHII